MIIIKPNHHQNNSGLGNKLILSCYAESYALETGLPVVNWLVTDVLHGGRRDGILYEDNNMGIQWRHLPDVVPSGMTFGEWIDTKSPEEFVVIGRDTKLSCHTFHQTPSDIALINKHRRAIVKDFGRRKGTFVHVRAGDTRGNMVPGIEYYKKCLSRSCSGYVSSDSPNHATVKYLLDNYDLKLYEKGRHNPEDTMIFGSTFDNKVLSLGTFSWWIGFIGNQNNVICPNPKNYTKWHGPIFEQMEEWRKI